MRAYLLAASVGALFTVALTNPSAAHQAPSGWAYPNECCSNRDCHMIDAEQIVEGPSGYVVTPSGETLGYTDPRVKQSPDGAYHWCAIPGSPRTICLFVPPQGS